MFAGVLPRLAGSCAPAGLGMSFQHPWRAGWRHRVASWVGPHAAQTEVVAGVLGRVLGHAMGGTQAGSDFFAEPVAAMDPTGASYLGRSEVTGAPHNRHMATARSVQGQFGAAAGVARGHYLLTARTVKDDRGQPSSPASRGCWRGLMPSASPPRRGFAAIPPRGFATRACSAPAPLPPAARLRTGRWRCVAEHSEDATVHWAHRASR